MSRFRAQVLRVTFDDGLVRELEFISSGNSGTVFEPLEDRAFFKRVRVDEDSGTIAWPTGVDLDPAVLHGDFPPSGKDHFREVSKQRR